MTNYNKTILSSIFFIHNLVQFKCSHEVKDKNSLVLFDFSYAILSMDTLGNILIEIAVIYLFRTKTGQ